MIGKLPVLAFAAVTLGAGPALAREPCEAQNRPAGYGYEYGPRGPAPVAYGGGYSGGGYSGGSYSGSIETGLRYSDLDRNGWVTLDEALAHGRLEFRRADRNGDRVLSRHEVGWQHGPHGQRGHRDGRLTRYEYQDAVRAQFARLDINRDGVLGRYELGLEPARPSRSAGWWQYR